MKDTFYISIIFLVGIFFYALTLHGVWGNPGPSAISFALNEPAKPFELSPERGRYSHVYSLAETGTYTLTKSWANVVYPDAGVYEGKYYSFFAPGMSYMAYPLYLIGKIFGLAQVFSFALVSLFAMASLILIYTICRNIFALPAWAALCSAFIFGFASTSWSYAVTLYQHHATVFFTLLAYYCVWKFRQRGGLSGIYALIVGGCYALAVFIDYPNAVLLLPVMIYFIVSVFNITKVSVGYMFNIRWAAIVAIISFGLITGLQFYHNTTYYGSWKRLSGALETYQIAKPVVATSTSSVVAVATSSLQKPVEKDVVGFFHEDSVMRGFYTLIMSNDRGLFFFSPIFLLALVGIFVLRKRLTPEYMTLVGIIAFNVFLYSSWGDPWGGWAFGPRYLILSMSALSIFVGVALSSVFNNLWGTSIAFILVSYSSFVALLGAVTTNAIPPKAEGLLLPAHKYNFLLNLDFLHRNESASFFYNAFMSNSISLTGYFILMYFVLTMVSMCIFFIFPLFEHE